MGNLINLAAAEKTKPANITKIWYCASLSRSEMKKIKKSLLFFFSNFQKKNESVGSVKRKIKNSGLNQIKIICTRKK